MADRATLAVGGLFLLLGTIFGGVALYLWSALEERQLSAEGRTARAELLRKDIVADRASGSIVRPAYRVHYRFAPEQGSPVSASARIDEAQRGGRSRTEYVALYRFDTPGGAKGEGRAVLEIAAWEAARPGDRLAVRYLPGEPGSNRPAGEGGWAYGIIISIVGPLFALIGAFLAWGSWLARHDSDAR